MWTFWNFFAQKWAAPNFYYLVSLQCEAVGRVADIIQIPAFLCRQVRSVDLISF